jgi:phosphate transport system permease protein
VSTVAAPAPTSRLPRRPGSKRATALFAEGQSAIWLAGGAMLLALAMILGLVVLVLSNGLTTFWPTPIVRVETVAGKRLMGEVAKLDRFRPEPSVFEALPEAAAGRARSAVEQAGGTAERRMLRTGNFELSGSHYHWVSDFEVAAETRPEWALVVERVAWGRFYGVPEAFLVDGERRAAGPEASWRAFLEHHKAARARFRERRRLETVEVHRENRRMDEARLEARAAELKHGADSPQARAAWAAYEGVAARAQEALDAIGRRIAVLDQENDRYAVLLETADGKEKRLRLADVVRAYPANRLSFWDKVAIYASRAWEFLSDEPREANSEGGVFPALFGTVTMTLVMSLLVVPFGVLAALYLREYAKAGPVVSAVRIAVNNLAGVPSIVFGVFGLGFFCYFIGGELIDPHLFPARTADNNPTFGKGGILWASLTLALLTLPVVIVATEEALAAVPRSMREGSYACGASQWQTIRRIVLPRAMPGIITGMILAIARGAGEVAPLMLVGAVKLAPELPVDGEFPFVHPERSFMHLGFHIYDLGFQSQNSEAAKPMVYTTTLLLILVVVVLNLTATWIRARLRRRFDVGSL